MIIRNLYTNSAMEVWKEVVGHEGLYEVSDCGGVRCVEHTTFMINNGTAIHRKVSAKNMSLLKAKGGYLKVALSKDKAIKQHLVHRLVAQAFIPNPENKPCVCHKDDVRTNNRADNLFWGTHLENEADKVSKGRQDRGEKRYNAVLTEDAVRDIRTGFPQHKPKYFAEKYGITVSYVGNLIKRRRWKHVA